MENREDFVYDLYTRAVAGGMTLEHASYCAGRVMERVNSGRSFDCDEYRSLEDAAKAGDAARNAVPFVDVQTESCDGQQDLRLSFQIRVF